MAKPVSPAPSRTPLWTMAVWLLVLVMHILGLTALRDWSRPQPVVRSGAEPLRLEFVFVPPPTPPGIEPPAREETPAEPAARRAPRVLPPTPVAEVAQPTPAPLQERALSERLYRDDGSLALSERLLNETDRATGVGRDFDFQIAGLETAGEIFDRPPALVYEATRFDGYWKPTNDVLTEVLEKAVRASTATVRIPIPGRPGWKLVCSVVVLAASGGCGMAGPDNPVLGLDDPNTLDADELRACETVWNQLTEARSQAERRRLSGIYETGCRKPALEG